MDHPCGNNPVGLLFQTVERSIWRVRLVWQAVKAKDCKNVLIRACTCHFFYGSGSPLQLSVRLLEPGCEWRAEGGGSENIWQERTRIGEGANLVVGGSEVKTVCVRLITAPGLMSRPQARRMCAFNRGTYADVTAMCKQILVDFLLDRVWPSHICATVLSRAWPPWVTSTLTFLVVAPQWGCTFPGWLAYSKNFSHVHRNVFLFCSTWS